jgi:carnitine 3-dehydrogenase
MLIHVDTNAGRACAWVEPLAEQVAAAAAAHVALPVPDGAGKAISLQSR